MVLSACDQNFLLKNTEITYLIYVDPWQYYTYMDDYFSDFYYKNRFL